MALKRLSLLLLFLLPLMTVAQTTVERDFKRHFDNYKVNGSFVLYDVQNNNYTVYNQERNKTAFIPASTFKIPNSLIALELKVVEDENTLMKWDSTERSITAWNKDLPFNEAFKVSCVPCYQEIARKVGVKNYRKSLKELNFGRMDVNADNLDTFWLTGKSNITPPEQVDFLVRLYNGTLPVSPLTINIVKKIMVLEERGKAILRGKTGWANHVDGAENNIGWLVGWIEKDEKAYFFATNVGATDPDESLFIKSRLGITKSILREMKLWE